MDKMIAKRPSQFFVEVELWDGADRLERVVAARMGPFRSKRSAEKAGEVVAGPVRELFEQRASGRMMTAPVTIEEIAQLPGVSIEDPATFLVEQARDRAMLAAMEFAHRSMSIIGRFVASSSEVEGVTPA